MEVAWRYLKKDPCTKLSLESRVLKDKRLNFSTQLLFEEQKVIAGKIHCWIRFQVGDIQH